MLISSSVRENLVIQSYDKHFKHMVSKGISFLISYRISNTKSRQGQTVIQIQRMTLCGPNVLSGCGTPFEKAALDLSLPSLRLVIQSSEPYRTFFKAGYPVIVRNNFGVVCSPTLAIQRGVRTLNIF